MIASKIIKQVEDFLGKKLPQEGLLTGQAVAEMYMEEVGFKNFQTEKVKFYQEKDFQFKIGKKYINQGCNLGYFHRKFDFWLYSPKSVALTVTLRKKLIINDIDIFVISKNASTANVLSSKYTYSVESDGYERIFYFDTENKYNIVSTENDGAINKTVVKFYNGGDYRTIINMFDINTTQFGIDLKTGEIIKSAAFDDFIKTGNMKIVNFSTPAHTYVRYLKKHAESKFRILDTEIMKAIFNIKYGHNTRRQKLYFSDKYKNLYQKYCMRHTSHHGLILESILLPIDPSEQKYNLYQLQVREGLAFSATFHCESIASKLKEIGFRNFSNAELNSKMIDVVFMGSKSIIAKNIETIKELNLSTEDYAVDFGLIVYKHLNENLDKNLLKRINNSLKEHDVINLYIKFNTMRELSSFDSFIRKLTKKFGFAVWAYVETLKDIPTEDEFLEGYNSFIELNSGDLKEKSFESFETESFKIKELTSSLDLMEEGSKMRHCVAGYGYALKSNLAIIISIENKKDRKLNSTLELRYVKNDYVGKTLFSTLNIETQKSLDNAMHVRQHMFFANKPVSEELTHEIIALIKDKINKKILSSKELYDIKRKASENSFVVPPVMPQNDCILELDDEEEIPF